MLRVWGLVCRVLRLRGAVSILAILLPVLAGAARAQTCTVTSTEDSTVAGTLRSCLASGDTTINFNLPSPSTITLTSATLMVPGGVTIEGPGANQLTVSGNHLFTVFTVTGGNVSISGLTIANGHGTVGGILGAAGANSFSFANGGTGFAVTVSNCTFSGNTSTGGAIIEGGTGGTGSGGGFGGTGGAVTVTDSTFSGNTSIGGVIEGGTGGTGSGGGGGGAVTVTDSTFSGNTSTGGGVIEGGGGGGGGNGLNGIGGGGGAVTVTNNTFSGNTSTGGVIEGGTGGTGTGGGGNGIGGGGNGIGGGGGAVTVTNNTFSGNTSTGGVIEGGTGGTGTGSGSATDGGDGGAVTVIDNIFWNNSGGDCSSGCTSTGSIDANPMLAPLGNYGGPTQTMLPLPGSPAICAGTTSGVTLPATDQRGFPLSPSTCPSGKVDAGAVQTNYLTVTTSADPGTGTCPGSSCSLREAIAAASDEDIDFSSTAFPATAGTPTTITLSPKSGGLIISGQVNIVGPGANVAAVSGNSSTAVGTILTADPGAEAFVYGLTITGGNSATIGGGISIATGGTVMVSNSTISGNSATELGSGGDIDLTAGGIFNVGTLTVSNCTISGNSAEIGGGGIFNFGTLTVSNSTISGNSGVSVGGIFDGGTLTVSMSNSIVSGNTVGSTESDISDESDVSGSGNVIGDTASQILLAPLGFYGGPTQTMPPLPGSPALNAGTYLAGEPTTDQRGAPRPATVGNAIDAGAVQISNEPPFITAVSPNSGPTAGGTQVTITGTGLDGSSASNTSVDFGMTPVEALASGKPVIAYDCDGAREVCRNNETGFLITPGDLAALQRCLLQLAESAPLRQRLGQAGQSFVRENFAVEKMVADIYNLYVKLSQH